MFFFVLYALEGGEGYIYAIPLYRTKHSLATIPTATDAGEYSQLGSSVQKQRIPHPFSFRLSLSVRGSKSSFMSTNTNLPPTVLHPNRHSRLLKSKAALV